MRPELAAICETHRLGLVYLFGSLSAQGLAYLSGAEARPTDPLADLDVGVVTLDPLPDPGSRADLYASIHNDLADVFRAFPVDLSFLEEGHSVFQAAAIGGACVFAASEQLREDYEMRVLRRAADFRPVLREFHREILEDL